MVTRRGRHRPVKPTYTEIGHAAIRTPNKWALAILRDAAEWSIYTTWYQGDIHLSSNYFSGLYSCIVYPSPLPTASRMQLHALALGLGLGAPPPGAGVGQAAASAVARRRPRASPTETPSSSSHTILHCGKSRSDNPGLLLLGCQHPRRTTYSISHFSQLASLAPLVVLAPRRLVAGREG